MTIVKRKANSKTTTLPMHHAVFYIIFLGVVAGLQRESA